jgi:O-antigen/teichoic acid export membrane protein
LKYDVSIILPRTTSHALDLTALAIATSVVSSTVMLGALLLSKLWWEVHWYHFLVPLSAVLGAIYTAAQQWSARASDYRSYATSQVLNSVANIGTALALAFVAHGLSGKLVIGYMVGLAVAAFYLSRGILHAAAAAGEHWRRRIDSLRAAAREYKRFPLYVLPAYFLTTVGLSAPPFVLQALFSLRDVGHYAIAARFLLIPSALIGGAISEAFRSEFVDRVRRDAELLHFFRHTLFKLCAFAAPCFLVFFVVAPPLFEWVFGTAFRESGELSRALCIGVFAQFVSMPFSHVFVATGRVRLGLVAQAGVSMLPLVGLLTGSLEGDMRSALLLSSIILLVTATLMVALAYRCCLNHERSRQGREAHA